MGERPGPFEKDMLGPNNPAEQAAAQDARRPFDAELKEQGAKMTVRQRQAMRGAGDRAEQKALQVAREQESPAYKATVVLGREKLIMDYGTQVSMFLFSDNAQARLGWGDRGRSSRDLPVFREQAEKTFDPAQDVYDVPLMRALIPEFGVRLLAKKLKLAELDSAKMREKMEECAARINEGMYYGPRGHQARNGVFDSPLDQQSVELGVLIRSVGKGEYAKLVELLEMTRQGESQRMTPADVAALNQHLAKERHGYGAVQRHRTILNKPESWDVLGLDRALEERGVIWNQEQGQYELRK